MALEEDMEAYEIKPKVVEMMKISPSGMPLTSMGNSSKVLDEIEGLEELIFG